MGFDGGRAYKYIEKLSVDIGVRPAEQKPNEGPQTGSHPSSTDSASKRGGWSSKPAQAES